MPRKPHYAYIPEPILLSKTFRKMRQSSRLLYVYMLARRAGKEWFTYPYTEIRRDSRFQYGTISVAVRELTKAGYLEYKHGGLERNYNRYRLPLA